MYLFATRSRSLANYCNYCSTSSKKPNNNRDVSSNHEYRISELEFENQKMMHAYNDLSRRVLLIEFNDLKKQNTYHQYVIDAVKGIDFSKVKDILKYLPNGDQIMNYLLGMLFICILSVLLFALVLMTFSIYKDIRRRK